MNRVSQKKYTEEKINRLVKALGNSREVKFVTSRARLSSVSSGTIWIKKTDGIGSSWKHIGEDNFYYSIFSYSGHGEFLKEDAFSSDRIRQKISESISILGKFLEGDARFTIRFWFCKSVENFPLKRRELGKAGSYFELTASNKGVWVKGNGFSGGFRKAFQIIEADWDESYNRFQTTVNNCLELKEFIEYIINYSEEEGFKMFVDPYFLEFDPRDDPDRKLICALAEYMSTNSSLFKGSLMLVFNADKIFSDLERVNPFFENAKLDMLLGEIIDDHNNKFALYKRVAGNGLFRLVYRDVKEYGSTFEPLEKIGFTEE